MAGTEDTLRKALYRAFCPDSMELDDYQLGTLSAEREKTIREHLKECPHCRLEMEQTRTFLEATQPDIEWGLADRFRVLVARLVKASGGAGMVAALQGVRGNEERILTFEAGALQVILDVQTDPQRSDLRAIYGLLMGAEAGQTFHAVLAGERKPAASEKVDEIGNFTFQSIAPGQYTLSLAGPALNVRIEELVIE
jgi:hypothetical protein